MPGRQIYGSMALIFCLFSGMSAYQLGPHPRILISRQSLPALTEHASGALAGEYKVIRAEADRAVTEGVKSLESHYSYPLDLVSLGICYLIERERGGTPDKYAEAVKRFWGDGRVMDLRCAHSCGTENLRRRAGPLAQALYGRAGDHAEKRALVVQSDLGARAPQYAPLPGRNHPEAFCRPGVGGGGHCS